MKRFSLSLAAISLLFLPSCNTWIGFTRDLQMAGKNMEEKASEPRQEQQPSYAPQQPAYDYNSAPYQGY